MVRNIFALYYRSGRTFYLVLSDSVELNPLNSDRKHYILHNTKWHCGCVLLSASVEKLAAELLLSLFHTRCLPRSL